MRATLSSAILCVLAACAGGAATDSGAGGRGGGDVPGQGDPGQSGSDDTGDWSHPAPEIACVASDAEMSFSPQDPAPGERVEVAVRAATGYVYIGMAVDRASEATALQGVQISDVEGGHEWAYAYSLDAEGGFFFQFTADDGATPICEGTVYAYGAGGGDDTGGSGDDTGATPGAGPHDNPIGIGLVGPGNSDQWDRAAELSGPGGHVKLIFPGLEPGMSGAHQEWKDAIAGVYERDLVPVVRMSPPWGQNEVRAWSDDAGHLSYTGYAASFAAVVADLPSRDGWPLWVEVHNEPNLCYEWTCAADAGSWIDGDTMAAEYASLLRDVHAAIDALGLDDVRVINGGLAPGGVVSCECGGEGWTGGATGLDFIDAMEAAVPGIFASLDGFASHSYPSSGQGYDFFVAYDSAGVGLGYWRDELTRAGVPGAQVLITETGWTVDAGAYGSRDDVAGWTRQAWQNDWLPEPQIEAVMPFQLQDAAWDAFGWVDTSNNPYPVFTEIRDWRCGMAFPEPC